MNQKRDSLWDIFHAAYGCRVFSEEKNKKTREELGLEVGIDVKKWDEMRKGQPQDTDPSKPHYFAPYDDLGNKRTINNAVDPGFSAID